MRTVKIQRHWSDKNQCTGTLLVLNENCQPIFGSLCLERGERNNQKMVSRIPAGIYDLVFEYSNRFKRSLWEIKHVPNRSECKIHQSNMWHELNGCIAPGVKLKDLDSDSYYDVTSSTKTLTEFHQALKGITKTTIEIVNE